jgi:dihydroceramidase
MSNSVSPTAKYKGGHDETETVGPELDAMSNSVDAMSNSGFWGPPNALHIFCESKYARSYYIAEFWNSLSSLVFCAAGAYALSKPEIRSDPIMWCAAVSLAAIGAGSFAFHATMRYVYELFDELPMLLLFACCLLTKAACLPQVLRPFERAYTACAVIAPLGCAVVYCVYGQYAFFVNSVTVLLVIDVTVGFAQRTEHRVIHLARAVTLLSLVIAKILWEVEVQNCEREPRVWILHVAWHALSCVSAYFGLFSNMSYRIESGVNPLFARRGQTCKLEWFGIPTATVQVLCMSPMTAAPDSEATAAKVKGTARASD